MDEINQCMFILPYMVANFDIYYGTGRWHVIKCQITGQNGDFAKFMGKTTLY